MLALLLFLLPAALEAQTLTPNTANVALDGSLTMTVTAGQAGGACWPGYAWHATHGGCRRQVLEQQTETQPCPAGASGQQTRLNTRHSHVLQASDHAVSDAWTLGAWNSAGCTAPSEPPGDLQQRIAESLQIDYALGTSPGANASYYAHLMLHKDSRQLWCYAVIHSYEWLPVPQEYPASGYQYMDTHSQILMNQCLIQGDTVLLGGKETGYGTVTLASVSANGCTYQFSRSSGFGPYPTPFHPTLHIC